MATVLWLKSEQEEAESPYLGSPPWCYQVCAQAVVGNLAAVAVEARNGHLPHVIV